MIFPGVPDPVWTIECSTLPELFEELARAPSQKEPPSILGYKGFYCTPNSTCLNFTKGFLISGVQIKALQYKLLDTAPPDQVDDGFKKEVQEYIESQ